MNCFNLRTDKITQDGVKVAFLADGTKLVRSSKLKGWVYCLCHSGRELEYVGKRTYHLYGWGEESVNISDLSEPELQELLSNERDQGAA